MAYKYAVVPHSSAEKIGVEKYRKETESGVIINQTDLLTYGREGMTFEDKVAELGGKVVTAFEAKCLIGK